MAEWEKTSTTAKRLQEAMDIANMKQADLARATGLSKGGISNYVIGRYEPKSDIISKLAKALNCSEMWLWGYDVPMERETPPPLTKDQLSEGEKAVVELFNRVPEDQRRLVLQMLRAALDSSKEK